MLRGICVHTTFLLTLFTVAGVAHGHPQNDRQATGDSNLQNPVQEPNRQGKAILNNNFPSISTFLHLDSFDQLQTPQADLSPTRFFSADRFNSFDSLAGLPKPNLKIPLNLDEPAIVGEDPLLFSSVPGSDPNLFSTAASGNKTCSSRLNNPDMEVTEEAQPVVSSGDQGDQSSEEIIDEITAQQNGRYRRSVSSAPSPDNYFPSFFSFFHSSTPFSIAYPSSDLHLKPDILEEFGLVQESPVKEHQAALEPENLSAATLPENIRPTRQNRFRFHSPPPPPRYPPFDPFNTTYIPLPGPSSPHFALPLTEGNPHNNRPSGFHFRRPIRQTTERHLFRYHNTADFLNSLDFRILTGLKN